MKPITIHVYILPQVVNSRLLQNFRESYFVAKQWVGKAGVLLCFTLLFPKTGANGTGTRTNEWGMLVK